MPTDRIEPATFVPPTMLTSKWTPEQLRGIQTTGKSLLVSAAAGSGKTSVLAERCVHLVCDAPQPCDVNELLVVTFTESAALGMRQRIAAALSDRIERGGSPRLAQQLALVDQAQISTLHSFCHRLLRQHFQQAALDPSFRVLDGDEALLTRRETARALFDDSYELDSDRSFHRLIDAYGDGNDAPVLRQILHAHELLTSVLDPVGWMNHARRSIAEAARDPIDLSEMGCDLLMVVRQGLQTMFRRCAEAKEQTRRLGCPAYCDYLDGLAQIIRHWTHVFFESGLDALCEAVKDLDWKQYKLPKQPGDDSRVAAGKAAVESVRKPMKEGDWRSLLRFTSEQWRTGMKAVIPHANAFLDLLERFQKRYEHAKGAARAVDFADLERMALGILRDGPAGMLDPSAIARSYHREFVHVLVDEYQDINQVQDAILRLISRECVQSERMPGNLFCVGDVKQSIYRFRLAEPRQFLAREDAFRDDGEIGEVIDLQANFRSRGRLLDALNDFFGRLMIGDATEIEYDDSHALRAGKIYPNDKRCFTGAPIELHILPDKIESVSNEGEETPEELDRTEREAQLIAARIREIIGNDTAHGMHVMHDGPDGLQSKPACYGDIVILLRAMRYKAEQFARVLRQSDISVYAQSGSGFFASVEVQDVLALLNVLDNQRQDIPLAALLRSPLAKMPEPESNLARIRLAYPSGVQGMAFHEAVFRYAIEQRNELADWLNKFFKELQKWRDAAHRRPLADVLWQIYQQTGYLTFVSGLQDGPQRAANLIELYERAAQFGNFQHQGLSRFLNFLHALREEADPAPAAVAIEAQNVVRIMSVHRAKGLEFPIVFLPDLGKQINLSDSRGHILLDRAGGLGMSVVDEQKQCRYPSLGLCLVKERLRRLALAEELRVLYVAATRAREHLIMIGTCSKKTEDQWAADWAGQDCKLPADVVLSARTMLDWIGPIEAMTAGTREPLFERMEMGDGIALAAGPKRPDSAPTPIQKAIARLDALPFPPASSPRAKAALERISYVDPYRSYGNVTASIAVTAVTEQASKEVRDSSPTPGALRTDNISRLATPRFLADRSIGSATDKGTATHLVLQHLNFIGLLSATDIELQIQAMVKHRIMTSAEAKWVDLSAVLWFVKSELGILMGENASKVRHEMSVYFPIAPKRPQGVVVSDDPMDRVMVRGRLDALIALPHGSIIIDYKTDSIPPLLVPSRAESYRPQLQAYREAIERITNKPVLRTSLVFLTAQMTYDV